MRCVKRRRVEFVVSFDLPPGAVVSEARSYVANAVATYHGSLRPPDGYFTGDEGDPMFQLDGASVRVTRLIRPSKREAARRPRPKRRVR